MKLIAYVHYNNGRCEEALDFYKEVLDGTVLMISRMGEGPMNVPEDQKNQIMHARLQLGESVLFMSDTFETNPVTSGTNISLSLDIDDVATIDTLFPKLAEGGKIDFPLENTFWGARFGMLTDKFGIKWMMNCELKK